MAKNSVGASFSQALKDALKHYTDPHWLGSYSPLAEPYFLGEELVLALQSPDAHICGRTLQRLLADCVRQIGREGAAQEMRLLELTYFSDATRIDAVFNELNIARATYFRARKRALERLERILLQRVKPALRLETPRPPALLVGRGELLNQCADALAMRQSIAITGVSGVGKTSMGASLFVRFRKSAPAFWYTFRPALNDQLSSLLFAIGYFMYQQGAPALWLQMVATLRDGDYEEPDWEVMSSLCRHTLNNSNHGPPLLCFDDIDLLQPEIDSEHARIVAFLESLRGLAPVIYLGQQVYLQADAYIETPVLSVTDIAELFAQTNIPAGSRGQFEELHMYTGGNPTIISLCLALFLTGHTIQQILDELSVQPSMEVLVRRICQRLEASEVELLFVLSVYRRTVPMGAWQRPDQLNAIRRLVERRLIQQDGRGALHVTPAYRAVLYQLMDDEQRSLHHLYAAGVRQRVGEFTAALHHFVQAGKTGEAISLWRAHKVAEINQGQGATAMKLFRDVSTTGLNQDQREKLTLINSELARLGGDYARAKEYLHAERWRNPLLQIEALDMEGDLAELNSEFTLAEKSYRNGLNAAEGLVEGRIAILHKNLGFVYKRQRLLDQAWNEAGLAAYEAKNFQGLIKIEQREYREAKVYLSSALEQAIELGHAAGEAKTRVNLARILIDSGEFETAFSHLQRAVQCYERIGRIDALAGCKLNWATGYNLAEQPENALPLAADALNIFEMLNNSWGRALACQCLAESHLLLKDLAQAEHYAQKVVHEEEIDMLPDGLRVLGEISVERQHFDDAQTYIGEAIRVAVENQDPYLEAYGWRAMMVMWLCQADLDNARMMRDKAMALFSEIELPREVQKTTQLFRKVGE